MRNNEKKTVEKGNILECTTKKLNSIKKKNNIEKTNVCIS